MGYSPSLKQRGFMMANKCRAWPWRCRMNEQAVSLYVSEEPGKRFNPREHLMQIKNKNGSNDYLAVQWRLVWFREQCPEGTIETELIQLDLDRETEEEAYAWNQETRRSEKIIKMARGYALFKAV